MPALAMRRIPVLAVSVLPLEEVLDRHRKRRAAEPFVPSSSYPILSCTHVISQYHMNTIVFTFYMMPIRFSQAQTSASSARALLDGSRS